MLARREFLLAAALVACRRTQAIAKDRVPVRIVSLSPSTTETVAAVGALASLVGRSRYCDYPPEVTKLPEVGGYVDPNVEAIAALHPDLVVGARGPAGRRIDDVLRERGVETYFPKTESIADVFEMIRGIGARLARAKNADDQIAAIQAKLATVERSYAGPKPSVVLLFGVQPIVASGPGSFGDEIVTRAGARNVVTRGNTYPTLDFEALASLDPDIIVDAAVAEEHGHQRIAADAAGWRELRAVKTNRVIAIPDEVVLRPGPRVGEGVTLLARALHSS